MNEVISPSPQVNGDSQTENANVREKFVRQLVIADIFRFSYLRWWYVANVTHSNKYPQLDWGGRGEDVAYPKHSQNPQPGSVLELVEACKG